MEKVTLLEDDGLRAGFPVRLYSQATYVGDVFPREMNVLFSEALGWPVSTPFYLVYPEIKRRGTATSGVSSSPFYLSVVVFLDGETGRSNQTSLLTPPARSCK
jgi:hypothetical protein